MTRILPGQINAYLKLSTPIRKYGDVFPDRDLHCGRAILGLMQFSPPEMTLTYRPMQPLLERYVTIFTKWST